MEELAGNVTQVLLAVGAGDKQAAEELLPLVYNELRRLAAARLARESPGQTLQATALVHEAWLRLGGASQPLWNSRAHFFGAAAEAMRRILLERARRKARLRHGGQTAEQLTQVIEAAGAGDAQAAEKLLPLVYEELRRLAAAKMAQEPPGKTLQPTALVHEAWLRIAGERHQQWNSRNHFFMEPHFPGLQPLGPLQHDLRGPAGPKHLLDHQGLRRRPPHVGHPDYSDSHHSQPAALGFQRWGQPAALLAPHRSAVSVRTRAELRGPIPGPPVTPPAMTNGATVSVTVPATNSSAFFRLVQNQ